MTLDTSNSYLNSLQSSTPAASSSSGSSASSDAIDMNGFLKLLTTQLQDQDPTSTQDTDQMVQQMATFSQVQGIAEMNSSLSSIESSLAGSRLDASGWLGRDALTASDTAAELSSGGYAGEITLPSDAKDMTISLVDSSGNTVHTEDLGAKSAGAVDWSWDGKDANGNTVGTGNLNVVVSATGQDGSISTTNATWTEVQSVQSPSSGTIKLITGLGTLSTSDVLQLS